MEGSRTAIWVEEEENEEDLEEMVDGWVGGEKKRKRDENSFRGEGEADIREILALAEAQELQAKLVSAGAQVEQLKEVVRRLNEEQEANMAELITEHRQGLEEERQSRERERQEFEGRLERLTVGGGTNKEAELKRQLVRRETAVGELRKQVIEILSSDNKATEYQVSRHRTMFVRLEEGTRRAIAEAATARAEARREAEEVEKVDFCEM